MHENLHKNVFIHIFVQIFMSFYEGQMLQLYTANFLYGFIPLKWQSILFKTALNFTNLMTQMIFSQIQQAPGPDSRKVEKSLKMSTFGYNFNDKSVPIDKSVHSKNNLLISQPKHMLWVLKRTVSMRGSFEHQKHMFKLIDEKIITLLR